MKKLALLISSALLMSSQAFAKEYPKDFIVQADVAELCSVETTFNTSNPLNITTANKEAPVTLKCNKSGMSIELSSFNQGLKHAEHTDGTHTIYNYTAELSGLTGSGIAGEKLTLDTSTAQKATETIADANLQAFANELSATLTVNKVTGMENAIQGTYTDTLTVKITTPTSR